MMKNIIRTRVRSMVGSDASVPLRFLQPVGDPGLFGPQSQAWKVHADFTSMMIGGVSALVLQALHPLALAGVWDHSSFRQDLQGRLARTAYVIAATTYGGTAMAHEALDRVRAIHARVQGLHADGRAYRADDPRLLYWVHLTETWSFLNAYRLFRQAHMTAQERDQYIAEMAVIPRELGCDPLALPGGRIATTEQQALRDLAAYLPELEFSERSRFVLQMLQDLRVGQAPASLQKVLVQAAIDHLPDWAYALMQRPVPGILQRSASRAVVLALAQPLRWALSDGIAEHAQRRMRASMATRTG